MDFKSINWAGNVYEKFEAMCLEVEEVMYEDSMKYVENQVQNVGLTVKKFYSEVIQDLLPPSGDEVEPIKVTAGDLSVNPCADTDINEKTKLSVLESQGELKKKEIANEDNSGLALKEISLSVRDDQSYLSPLSPTAVVENTLSQLCPVKYNKLGVHKRPIGIRRISQTNGLPRTSTTSQSRDRSSMASSETTNICVIASDVTNATIFSATESMHPSDACGESFAYKKKILYESPKQGKDISECTFHVSEKNSSAELLRQKKDSCEQMTSYNGLPSTIGTSIKDDLFSESVSKFSSNACVESGSQDVATSTEDLMVVDGSYFQMHPNVSIERYNSESAGEEVVVSYDENFDMEVIDNEDIAESDDPFGNSKFEETCVLVEGDMLPLISQTNEKCKSYKKKICEALSSNLRSTRQCGSVNNRKSAMDSNTRNVQAPESFGSDWELL